MDAFDRFWLHKRTIPGLPRASPRYWPSWRRKALFVDIFDFCSGARVERSPVGGSSPLCLDQRTSPRSHVRSGKCAISGPMPTDEPCVDLLAQQGEIDPDRVSLSSIMPQLPPSRPRRRIRKLARPSRPDQPLPFSVIKSKFRVALTDRFGILLCTSDGREVP
jgi:hypothetical protein